ncbi:bifunctional pyr operon transcriptional regulator/uracil phosphoribosyltransferase PyrR [Flavobacteriales bacterium]|nr:bifunctional pyr operon transcriptional regulator/uracil phosphoribosyltransferase PyrR [Flavobacteriales bacterium]|tara:strand:- start:272 stop:817 length:546 start_codon:yes stop_codon:yes gene_type:complete
MQPREIINTTEFNLVIKRLAFQLIENHTNFEDTVLIGLQSKGVCLSDRLQQVLQEINPELKINVGYLDITFFRDDFRRTNKPLIANETKINFIIEGKKVVLVDDVLFTGRTIRAGLDAMLAFGRPSLVELLVLVDRRYKRDLPIQPTYVGKVVDSITSEKVTVEWEEVDGEDKVLMYSSEK